MSAKAEPLQCLLFFCTRREEEHFSGLLETRRADLLLKMASKEEAVVTECALQLRALGDLIYWKYVLLEFLAKHIQAANEDSAGGT